MKRLALIFLLVLVAGCKTVPPVTPAETEAQRQRLSVTMLVVNLRDVYNVPDFPVNAQPQGGIGWKQRFTRIAQWIAYQQPDLLVMQEMPGYWCGSRVMDYEAAHYLVEQIRQLSQKEYRIAYLLSHKLGGGHGDWWSGNERLGLCETRGGRALLYRSDRINNAQTQPGLDFATEGIAGAMLINSLPCCHPRPGTEAVCLRIDGPYVNSPACPHSIPAGAAFTQRQSLPAGNMAAVFSRLELRAQPGNFIHLYNVHLDNKDLNEWQSTATLRAFVAGMEQRFSTAGGRLYPPIVAGDFNLGRAAMDKSFLNPGQNLSAFSVLYWSREVMGVLSGAPDRFPSTHGFLVRELRELPDFGCTAGENALPSNPLTLWSDHCASIYFKLVPDI